MEASTVTQLPARAAHEAAGAEFRELLGWSVVDHFGDAAAEQRAVREAAGLLDASFLTLVRARGADVPDYLNRRLSQRVIELPPGAGVRAFQLDGVGRMEADLEYFRLSDESSLLVAPPALSAPQLAALCDKYVFSEDAKFEACTGEWNVLALIGPKSGDALSAAGLPFPASGERIVEGTGGTLVLRSENFLNHHLVLLPAGDSEQAASLESAVRDCGGGRIGWRAFDALRVSAGAPWHGIDTGRESIPLEAGLLSGIHTNKGCYPGQETIAKTMNLGHPARRLVGLTWRGDSLPGLPAPLFLKDKEVGRLTSATREPATGACLGLGTVRFIYAEDDYEVFLADGTELTIQTRFPLDGA